jgi:phosphonoacetaldehyde hydrolase
VQKKDTKMLQVHAQKTREIKAVIFDWAGTMIDFGSFAPMGVFIEAFAEFGIKTTIDEARAPMGMPKWHHIKAMTEMPNINEAWRKKYGTAPSDKDVDKIYEVFVPMNEKVVAQYATLVPGATDMLGYLKKKNIKVGSTTGYTRSIMENVLPIAARQGYSPENLVCSDDLKEGRPGPLGIYKCMVDLAVYPAETIIKVDDTEPGIAEGVSAGCITVGVSLSGNYAGKTPAELAALAPEEVAALREEATAKLLNAGANYVIDTVADLPALMDTITKNTNALSYD